MNTINLVLTLSVNCIISNAVNQATIFAITNRKLYALVVILSTKDFSRLLQRLKSGFKTTVRINITQNYQQKDKTNI